jgi:hypothetical protein
LSTVLLAIIQEEANFQNNILPLWSFPVSEILAKLGVGTDFPQQLWKRQISVGVLCDCYLWKQSWLQFGWLGIGRKSTFSICKSMTTVTS